MRVRSILAVIVVAAVLAPGIGAGTVPGDAPQPSSDGRIEYDETLLRVDVRADGDAAWTIAYRVTLDDANTTEAFESLRADVRANRSSFESQFAARLNRTARAAENATGREMAIRNVSVDTATEVPETGVVRYTFEWTTFAAASGTELRVGDAIAGTVLDADTTLFVTWPAEYGVTSISPDADERRSGVAVWDGRRTFATDEPRIVLGTVTPTPTAAEPGPGTDDRTDTAGPPSGSGIDPLLLGAVAVVGGLGVAAWYVTRDDGSADPGVAATIGRDGDADWTDPSDDGAGTDEGGAGDDEPPEELLSNEERVLRLLEANGGRMKQQQVVRELDWTDAKTSQVVGTLREEDEVDVYRIGRENVLALPGETDL